MLHLFASFLALAGEVPEFEVTQESLDWYRTLNKEQKIFLRKECATICGVTFADLIKIFTFKEVIQLVFDKLKQVSII